MRSLLKANTSSLSGPRRDALVAGAPTHPTTTGQNRGQEPRSGSINQPRVGAFCATLGSWHHQPPANPETLLRPKNGETFEVAEEPEKNVHRPGLRCSAAASGYSGAS
jgi:hypothetical protein